MDAHEQTKTGVRMNQFNRLRARHPVSPNFDAIANMCLLTYSYFVIPHIQLLREEYLMRVWQFKCKSFMCSVMSEI
jgi:hypothetical protein